jgi:hypothetical protein
MQMISDIRREIGALMSLLSQFVQQTAFFKFKRASSTAAAEKIRVSSGRILKSGVTMSPDGNAAELSL